MSNVIQTLYAGGVSRSLVVYVKVVMSVKAVSSGDGGKELYVGFLLDWLRVAKDLRVITRERQIIVNGPTRSHGRQNGATKLHDMQELGPDPALYYGYHSEG